MVFIAMKNKEKGFEQSVTRAMRICFALNMLIIAILLSQGCVRNIIPGWGMSKSGYYYVAKQDEMLAEIAKAHQTDIRELSALNGLRDDVTIIKKGTVLFVPGFVPSWDNSSDDAKRVLWTGEGRKTPSKNVNTAGDQKKAAEPVYVAGEKKEPEVRVLEGSLVEKTPGNIHKETSKEIPKTPAKDTQPAVTKEKSTEPGNAAKEQKVAKTEVRPIEKKKAEQNDKKPSEPVAHTAPEKGLEKRFIWPAKGKVISSYGPQKNGMFYNGISVGVSKETTIVAAAEGYVIFSATLKDYGETVIIRHDAQYATVYTHLTKSFVKPDQKIKQGDPIALVSPSQGSSSFAFEIRHKNKAQDPIPLLSP